MGGKPTIYILTGPTAVGKTELALRWAEDNEAEIISCDSLLFYRGMNIGTAKPSANELQRVPHHLVDICEPSQPMNVAGYVRLARDAVDEIVRRGRQVLVTGGSGFYLKAFFGPVADEVSVPPSLRTALQTRFENHGLADLVRELESLNPNGLARLDTANPRRVLRALERCLVSGKTLEELQTAFLAQPGPFADFDPVCVQLDRQPAELNQRIEKRVDHMIAAGLIDEVASLDSQKFRANPSASHSIGYRETLAMLDGNLASSDLAAEISRNTRALVKKQRTWFRTQLPTHEVTMAEGLDAQFLFKSSEAGVG